MFHCFTLLDSSKFLIWPWNWLSMQVNISLGCIIRLDLLWTKSSTSIYHPVLLHVWFVCHFHHHPQTFPQIRLIHWDTLAYILDLASTNFSNVSCNQSTYFNFKSSLRTRTTHMHVMPLSLPRFILWELSFWFILPILQAFSFILQICERLCKRKVKMYNLSTFPFRPDTIRNSEVQWWPKIP